MDSTIEYLVTNVTVSSALPTGYILLELKPVAIKGVAHLLPRLVLPVLGNKETYPIDSVWTMTMELIRKE